MPTWNMFSRDVLDQMQDIRDRGGSDYGSAQNPRPKHATSFKLQALQELAFRLVCQEEIQQLKSQIADLIDENERLKD